MKRPTIEIGSQVMLSNGQPGLIVGSWNDGAYFVKMEKEDSKAYFQTVLHYEIEMVNIDGVWHHLALTEKQKHLKKQIEQLY